MTAIAMQQAAAAAAAGQQFIMQSNMQLLPAMVNQIQTAEQTKEEEKPAEADKASPDAETVPAAPATETDV